MMGAGCSLTGLGLACHALRHFLNREGGGMGGELTRLSATEAVKRLNSGDVSPLEMVDALPTRCPDRARAHARRIMENGPPEGNGPWLGGLPIAVKELVDVAGVRSTKASPVYADRVPARSDVVVETLEAHGAIVIAKANASELGAGAQTFNEVFGKTRNPWNTALSCGGSSGGSAVALATGEVWLATGSDRGGSQHQNGLNPLLCQTLGKTGIVHSGNIRHKVISRHRVVIVLAEFRSQTLCKISPDGRVFN